MTEGRVLTVAFDALSSARWAPVFQVLWLERPGVHLRWLAAGFTDGRPSLLDGADVGLFVAPRDEDGLTALTIEESQMVALLAVGHELAGRAELSVADIDGHPLAAAPTLEEWLDLIASGQAIATIPAAVAGGLPHPGVVTMPLTDGPLVPTCLVWRSHDQNPLVRSLVDLAAEMSGGQQDR